jgi:hypothetical protein
MAGLMAAGKSHRRAAEAPLFAARWGELLFPAATQELPKAVVFSRFFAAVLSCATIT